MKFNPIILLVLVLSNVSCISNRKLNSQLTYLEESQSVIDTFYKTFGDSTVVYIPKAKFQKGRKGKKHVQQKYTKSTQRAIGQYHIKPYIALNSSDQFLLNKWANKFGEAKNGEELYYKLINYWLLSHELCHQLYMPKNTPSDDVWQNEINIEKHNLYFLIVNDYTKKFKNFHKLIKGMAAEAEKRVGTHNDLTKIHKDAKKTNDFLHYFYFKSMAMMEVFEEVSKNLK